MHGILLRKNEDMLRPHVDNKLNGATNLVSRKGDFLALARQIPAICATDALERRLRNPVAHFAFALIRGVEMGSENALARVLKVTAVDAYAGADFRIPLEVCPAFPTFASRHDSGGESRGKNYRQVGERF